MLYIKKIIILTSIISISYFNLGFALGFAFQDLLFSPSSQMQRLVFVEDFYRLYTQNLYRSTISIHTQIHYLKLALHAAEKNRWWMHPIRSFVFEQGMFQDSVLSKNSKLPQAYHAKYRQLMKIKIALLLTQEHIQLANRYDLNHVYWFHEKNYPLIINKKNKDIHYLKSSFNIAKKYYQQAEQYWNLTQKYTKIIVEEAYPLSDKKHIPYTSISIKSEFVKSIEDEAYQIYFRNDPDYKKQLNYSHTQSYPKYNYDKLLNARLSSLQDKLGQLERYLSRKP